MSDSKDLPDLVDEMLAPIGVHVDREKLAELYPPCESQGCKGRAGYRVHWPGRSLLMCIPCTGRAHGLAAIMGFELTTDLVG